jgi:hypothetical protein
MRWLYTCIVCPALTYGAVVWAKSTQMKSVQAKMNKVQRLGQVSIAPMRQNTPTAGLELICGVQPLHIRIISLAVQTYNRLDLSPEKWTEKQAVDLATYDGLINNQNHSLIATCRIE